MDKKEFYELAKNRNLYIVDKPLRGDLSYAKIGDRYYSDTLYERGYNILQLVKDGVLRLLAEPYDWQKELVGKNIHAVHVWCPECLTFGINEPLDTTCGNCGYTEGHTYYDAHTINELVRQLTKKP